MNAVISSTSTKIIKQVGDQLHESGIEIYLINSCMFIKENSILEWNHENLQSGNKTLKYKS